MSEDILETAKYVLGKRDLFGSQDRDKHSEDCKFWHTHCLVEAMAAEISRLREELKPVGWCVQAAAGTMVRAGTYLPVNAAVLIQCKDEAYARMLSAVYGHKVLMIVEAVEKEANRG